MTLKISWIYLLKYFDLACQLQSVFGYFFFYNGPDNEIERENTPLRWFSGILTSIDRSLVGPRLMVGEACDRTDLGQFWKRPGTNLDKIDFFFRKQKGLSRRKVRSLDIVSVQVFEHMYARQFRLPQQFFRQFLFLSSINFLPPSTTRNSLRKKGSILELTWGFKSIPHHAKGRQAVASSIKAFTEARQDSELWWWRLDLQVQVTGCYCNVALFGAILGNPEGFWCNIGRLQRSGRMLKIFGKARCRLDKFPLPLSGSGPSHHCPGSLYRFFVRNAGCKIIPGLGYRTLTFLHINQFQTFRTATLTRLYRQASVAFLTVFFPHTITMSAGPKFTLNSGFEIPAIGLGKSKQMGVRRATIHFDFI